MAQTIIPIEIAKLEEDSFHLFIKAEFSNNRIGNLLIDTGASKTVLDKIFAEDLIIEHIVKDEEITSSGINNAIDDIEFVKLEHMSFVDMRIDDFSTAIMDLTHINTLYKEFGNRQIAGLIGSDFLVKYNALISYKAKHLILEY
jgi:Aspartyl protease